MTMSVYCEPQTLACLPASGRGRERHLSHEVACAVRQLGHTSMIAKLRVGNEFLRQALGNAWIGHFKGARKPREAPRDRPRAGVRNLKGRS